MKKGPLDGVKVIEIAGIGPAPCAGMMLADMGAEVILIERKVKNNNESSVVSNSKAAFYNRGKKSMTVDLKSASGIKVVLALIENADVLIEGFRPGVMERLGLGPDVCLAVNAKLVYGRMTGWGQTGPLAQTAGHEPNYIGISGAMWYGGRVDTAPSSPLTLVGDLGGGTMMLISGVLAALVSTAKTGKGQVIDAAITDGSAYLSSLLWMMHNAGQVDDNYGVGWADGAAPWNSTYCCNDGRYVTVCALEPQFYQEFLQRLSLTSHELFVGQWNKGMWSDAKDYLSQLFLSQSRGYWCELFEGSDACFSAVLDFTEAPLHPHNVARQTFVTIDGVIQPAPAPRFSLYQANVGKPPVIGQHTKEILVEAGFTEQLIDQLVRDRVV